MIAAIILSGLALLAAIGCVIRTARDEKRNQERNAALLRYVDMTAGKILKENEGNTKAAQSQIVEMSTLIAEISARIEKLEKGVIPDYEQATAAVDAVNSFSQGITNILGFDPVEAMKADRRKKDLGDVQ